MATPSIESVQQSEGRQLGRGTNPQFSVTDGQATFVSPNSTLKSIKLCVYTMKEGVKSDNMKFSQGRLTTTKQVLERVLPALGIPQSHRKVFALWLKSNNLQIQLKGYHLPCKLFKRWKDLLSQYTNVTYESVCTEEPYLCLQRNTFLSIQEEKELLQSPTADKTTIDLLYHEAVYNVCNSQYPVEQEELHTLAGLQAAAIKAESGHEITPNLHCYYPSYMCMDKRSLVNKLLSSKPSALIRQRQEQLMESYKQAYQESSNASELKLKYLKRCWKHSVYGSVYFRGQIRKQPKAVHYLYYSDRKVHVAINTESVHILSATSPTEVLLYERIAGLCWEFKESSDEGEDYYSALWLEYEVTLEDKKIFKLLQVFSRQAPMMDALLCRCSQQLDLSQQSPSATDTPKQEHKPREHKLHCDEYSQDGVCLKVTDPSRKIRDKKDSSPQSSTGIVEQELSAKNLEGAIEGSHKKPATPLSTAV